MMKFFLKKKNQGIVSIFLLIILLPTMIFSTMLMEIGRYYNAKNLLDEAAQNAATSMLASYNNELYKKFGLYAFDEQDTTKLKEKFVKYLKSNCNLESMPVESGYSMAASQLVNLTKNIDVETMYDLRESKVLIRQIEEYSKYRAPVELMNDILNIDKLKKDLLTKLSKTIFGENSYKTVEHGLKSVEMFLDMAKDLKDMFLTIRDLEGSVEGATFGEEITLLISKIKAYFNDKTYQKKKYEDGLNFSDAKKALKKALEDRKNYIDKLDEKIQVQNDLITIAKGIKEYYEKNKNSTQQDDTEIAIEKDLEKQFKEMFLDFGKRASGLTEENTLQDYFNMVKDEKYEFKLSSENVLSMDVIEKIINRSDDVLGKKDTKINELNETVREKQEKYISSMEEVGKFFQPYITQVNKLQDSIVSYQESSDSATLQGTKEFIDKINDFLVSGVDAIRQKAEEGKLLCQQEATRISQISYLNLQKGDISGLTKSKIKSYYLGYISAKALVEYAYSFKIKDLVKDSPIMQLINGLKKIGSVMRIDPFLYSNERQVVLSEQTLGMFQNSSGYTPAKMSNDSAERKKFLDDAKKNVPDQYINEIDKLDEEKQNENNTLYNTIIDRMNETSTAIYRLCGGSQGNGVVQEAMDLNSGAISMAVKIVSHIEDIKTVINNLMWFAGQMSSNGGLLAEALTKSLRTKLLTAYYIQKKMTTRLDKTRINVYDDAQVFSSANFEYVLIGDKSEKENQQRLFWYIFIIRLVMNIVVVLTSTEGEALLSIPIVGVIIVIAWIYYETNMDMNLLLRVGTSIPVIKRNPILSLENLANMGESIEKWIADLENMDAGKNNQNTGGNNQNTNGNDSGNDAQKDSENDSQKKKCEEKKNQLLGESEDTIFDWKYKDYLLLFTLFTPESILISNLGNVIQMEMRYEQRKKGKEATFLLHKANTYMRTEVNAVLNPLLPVRSLSKEYDMSIFGLKEVHYNGY